jgi:hypothetical protein
MCVQRPGSSLSSSEQVIWTDLLSFRDLNVPHKNSTLI